jgi:biotin operon repressor
MKNLDRCYDAVLLSSTKGGISAAEISKKIGMHKTMVHRNLNTLELMGKVESRHGVWRVKAGEQTIIPLEKEIVIQLPLPKDQAVPIGLLEILANDLEKANFRETAKMHRVLLEKLKETRTITITGKNVDSLDLDKVQNLILQAHQKGSKINLKGLLKKLKRTHDMLESSAEDGNKRQTSSET